MKNLFFKGLIAFLVICFFTACDPQWDTNIDVEVSNNSSKKLSVFFADPIWSGKDTIIEIEPNIINSRILSFKNFCFGSPSPGPVEFIIFNKLDSTSLSLKNSEFGLYKEVVNETTIVESGNIFGGISRANLQVSLNISDSLLSKMTKNTHLTDSIFSLKK